MYVRFAGEARARREGIWGMAHSTLLHARVSSLNHVFALVLLVSVLSISLESRSNCYHILEAQVKSASSEQR